MAPRCRVPFKSEAAKLRVMSAIVGILQRAGLAVERPSIERMTEVLAHRGAGTDVWHEGVVALGSRQTALEAQPFVFENCIIVADARLDYRAALRAELELPAASRDIELIAHAYEKWGEECAAHLDGDFAFAIWDTSKHRLFCARDHFGVRPFYYFLSDELFVFGSEIKALLTHPNVPRKLNETRVARYLDSLFEDASDTFYEGIHRLPPAHSLTIEGREVEKRRYYSLDPERQAAPATDAEYAAKLRDLLTQAVQSRLDESQNLAALLSGGLDSSTLTCLARQILRARADALPLQTYSNVFDVLIQCDERPFINAVLQDGDLTPGFIAGDQGGPFEDIERVLWHQDEPFPGPALFQNWHLYTHAQGQGSRALLDGHGGDEAISFGNGFLIELARARRWRELWREIKGAAANYDESPREVFTAYWKAFGWNPLVSRSRALRLAQRGSRAIMRRASRLKSQLRNPNDALESGVPTLISPDFAARIGLDDLRRAQKSPAILTERQDHFQTVSGGLQPLALEVLDHASAAFGLELRFPFWDRRVIEYCLSLPPEQKLSGGWTRLILRRAMQDVLPPSIQWRRDKLDFGANFLRGLLEHDGKSLRDALAQADNVAPYLDVEALRALGQRLIEGRSANATRDGSAVWQIVLLSLWLRQSGFAN